MKKIVLLIITITIILTSCQPTPEAEIVQSKSENLVEQVQEANVPENAEQLEQDMKIIEEQITKINGHINAEIDTVNPRTNIIIDADIIMPDYDTIPLVKVKPSGLTKEDFKHFADVMTGGRELYYMYPPNVDIHNTYTPWLTKEELEVILPEVKALEFNENLESHYKKWLKNIISDLEKDYAYARYKSDDVPYDDELTAIENNKAYESVTEVKAYMGKNQAAQLAFWNSMNDTSDSMVFSNFDYLKGSNTLEPYEGVDADKINMTYDEALALAVETLKALNGDEMNFMVVDASVGYTIGRYSGYTKEDSPQSYAFRFARAYDGIPVKPFNYLRGDFTKIDYTQQICPEIFTIGIDDEGVCYCSWKHPTEYIETVADDTPLLDFEKIQEIFENQLRYQFEWIPMGDTCPDDLGAAITINSIELNLMVTAEKDNIEEYLVIPVWDLIGNVEYTDTWIGPEGLEMMPPNNVSILTINAIDGSIINREQGY